MSEFCSELQCINAESTCELMDVFNAGIIITCSSSMASLPTHCYKISYIMAFVQWAIEILRVFDINQRAQKSSLLCSIQVQLTHELSVQY